MTVSSDKQLLPQRMGRGERGETWDRHHDDGGEQKKEAAAVEVEGEGVVGPKLALAPKFF